MASMTRVNMRDELKAHGWSRYSDPSLDRYLDWGLQRTYTEGSFDRSVRDETTIAGTLLDQLTYASVSGASSELLQAVRSVYVKDASGYPGKLRYATDDFFRSAIRPNMEASTPITGFPSLYYVFDGNIVLYPKPTPAVDIVVDWMRRKDIFANDADTSGLPERFDKIILAWAESFCHRRARELNDQLNLERTAREMMLAEMGQELSEAAEHVGRVTPWGA